MLYTAGKVFLVDVTRNVPVFRSVLSTAISMTRRSMKFGTSAVTISGTRCMAFFTFHFQRNRNSYPFSFFSDFSRLKCKVGRRRIRHRGRQAHNRAMPRSVDAADRRRLVRSLRPQEWRMRLRSPRERSSRPFSATATALTSISADVKLAPDSAVSESMALRLVARLFGSGISAGMSPPAMLTPFGRFVASMRIGPI